MNERDNVPNRVRNKLFYILYKTERMALTLTIHALLIFGGLALDSVVFEISFMPNAMLNAPRLCSCRIVQRFTTRKIRSLAAVDSASRKRNRRDMSIQKHRRFYAWNQNKVRNIFHFWARHRRSSRWRWPKYDNTANAKARRWQRSFLLRIYADKAKLLNRFVFIVSLDRLQGSSQPQMR